MAEDIAPELLEKIQEEFRKNCSSNKELQEISRKVTDGTANCVDLENYAIAAGDMLAKALHNNVSGDILPDGKMYYNIASRILPPNLEECHAMVADIAEGIYGVLNEKAGIHIKAQRPDLNRDRIDGIVDYVSNAEQYEDVRKSTEQSIVNFSQSVATDAVHKNADFQYKAGLSPKIRRSAEGNCCKWCQSLEGTYDYADVRNTGNDVWRRHRDCRCEVTYDPGTGRTQNARSKTWSWKEENKEKVGERIKTAELSSDSNKINRGLAAGNSTGNVIPEHDPPELIRKLLDGENRRSVLLQYEQEIADEPIENAIIITKDGEIYRCRGNLNGVWPDFDLGDKIYGADMTHNHPVGSDNEYSFSSRDVELFEGYDLNSLRGIDYLFKYELNRDSSRIDKPTPIILFDEYSPQHEFVITLATDRGYGYVRERRESSISG